MCYPQLVDMKPRAARMLRQARRRAGLTQRELAAKVGVPQSTIGRIESGAMDPRTETLIKLLRACGDDLEAMRRIGMGVDRTLARALLELSEEERAEAVSSGALMLFELEKARIVG